VNPADESDHTEEDLSVFEKNMSRLLSHAYEPERPSEAFVESAVGRMLGRAKGEAARRRRRTLAFWDWPDPWGKPAAVLAAGTLVLAVGLLGGFFARQHFMRAANDTQGLAVAVNDSEQAVATLASAVDAVWGAPLKESARLGAGLLHLKEGVAQVVFAKGAVVSLEAPVELELINDSLCRLVSGAVAATVPADAIGFTVVTPDMRIIDLGTSFGVRIGDDASTEVHVFDGEVDLVDTEGKSRQPNRLLEGQALRLLSRGELVSIKADPKSFIKNADVARQVERRREQARQRWVEYSQRWKTDPSVVLRYDFDATSAKSVLNTVNAGAHPALATNTSPRLIEGRWPGKRAMLFDGRTDVLTVADHPDLRMENDFSLAVWLRMSGQPYGGWTRVCGKGVGTLRNYGLWTPGNGRLVWQICPQGKFEWWDTEVATRPIDTNKWHLLVGVLADDMGKIYVDGRLELARAMDRPVATSADPLTIGHYSDVPAHEGYFSGELDELILLNRALSAREIAEMYAAGRPE
jgi:hypothetical protein